MTAIRATGVLPTLGWLTDYDVVVLADKGYQGPGHGILTPYKGRDLTPSYANANRTHAAIRSRGERGFAIEKNWRILRRYRASTHRHHHRQRCPRPGDSHLTIRLEKAQYDTI